MSDFEIETSSIFEFLAQGEYRLVIILMIYYIIAAFLLFAVFFFFGFVIWNAARFLRWFFCCCGLRKKKLDVVASSIVTGACLTDELGWLRIELKNVREENARLKKEIERIQS